jgi:putative endonuclease
MEIVERNWRTKAGEIDIVALDGEDLVFVEVKTRRSERAGTADEAVSPAKQRRVAKLAAAYLKEAGLGADVSVRFDAIAIRVLAPDRALLRHHRAAFGSAS